MLEKNKKSFKPRFKSRYTISKPLTSKIAVDTVAILMDLWQYSEWTQDAILRAVNNMPSIDYVLLATYGWNGSMSGRERKQGIYNSYLRETILKPTIELIPYLDDSENSITMHPQTPEGKEKVIKEELEKLHSWIQYKKVIMMGGAYGLCLHNRPFGINNLAKYYRDNDLKTKIYINPSAISLPNLTIMKNDNRPADLIQSEILTNAGPGDNALLKKVINLPPKELKRIYSSVDGKPLVAHLNYKILDRAKDWFPSEIDNQAVFLYKTLPELQKTII